MNVSVFFYRLVWDVLLLVFSAVSKGYVLSVLWGWFIVPIFGAPALGVVPAIGLAVMLAYLSYRAYGHQKDERSWSDQFLERSVMSVVHPSFALCFGWIVHLFM